eukprot:10488739-Karenia_brevis.AAC.1
MTPPRIQLAQGCKNSLFHGCKAVIHSWRRQRSPVFAAMRLPPGWRLQVSTKFGSGVAYHGLHGYRVCIP